KKKKKQMIEVFKTTGYKMNLIVEEHKICDIMKLLESVVRCVTDAIRAIKVSKNKGLLFEFVTLLNVTLVTKKKKFVHIFKAFAGIDFGTDGTGFAYSISDGKVYIEQKWERHLLAEVKNKTNILLDKNGKFVAFGQEATDKYISTSDRSLEFYERFKMALYDKTLEGVHEDKHDDEKKEKDLEPYLTAANGKKRKSMDVLVEALKFMRKHIMQVLRDTKVVQKVEDVQWVLTVPAIWSNTAKNRMREAAILAGLINESIPDHLIIAFEPECGSVIARKYCDFKKNDKYILLDLGGGTADIACHKILNNINVSQIYIPSGGPWGSTYIDEAFWGLLCEIFGRELMGEFKVKYPNEFIRLKENFRQAKHSYNPTSLETPKIMMDSIMDFMDMHKIDLETMSKKMREYKFKSVDNVLELDENVATLSLGHVGWKFLIDKVVDPLITHMRKLLEEPELRGCETMLCVGGLSTSPYVIERLRDVFVTDRKIIKTITAPERPISAVMEGAARFAMSPSLIAEYLMEHTYGLKCARIWEKSDGEERKLWSEEDNVFIFEDGFQVFVRKGDIMNVYHPPKLQWFQPLKKGDKEIVIEIHRSNEVSPRQCTNETFCAKGTFKLPPDWWDGIDAENKEIPIGFFFNRAEIQVRVQLKNYPENERHIKIEWLERM
ncbi:hypothetical protein RFI_31704, partial [Reticulomyxa filosa]